MSNSIKVKTTFVGEYTTYKTLTERVNTFVVILPNENKIKIHRAVHPLWWSSFPSSLQNIFHCHKFQRLSNYRRGKIQLNATHWTPISNVSNAFAVIFADPQREGYKLHSLLGSVGKRAETNFNFPAPPFNHISGICKNLADTWPAATRVLSRGRKREDPGNVKIW